MVNIGNHWYWDYGKFYHFFLICILKFLYNKNVSYLCIKRKIKVFFYVLLCKLPFSSFVFKFVTGFGFLGSRLDYVAGFLPGELPETPENLEQTGAACFSWSLGLGHHNPGHQIKSHSSPTARQHHSTLWVARPPCDALCMSWEPL
jgi:hypothetical protein